MARHAIDAACTEHKNTEDTDFYTVLSKKLILSQCIDNYYWHYSFITVKNSSGKIGVTFVTHRKESKSKCMRHVFMPLMNKQPHAV